MDGVPAARPTGFPPVPLSAAELDRLKVLLRQYPSGTPEEFCELEQLYERAGATEVMALMEDPDLRRRLQRLDPPVDLQWDHVVAWAALGVAILLVLWLVILPVLQ